MDISVILCTYNRCERLERVLDSFSAVRTDPGTSWELLVVDNNSSDRTKEVVKRAMTKSRRTVRYLFEGRQGKSNALNSGIKAAEGDILAFTDDDVTVHPLWIEEMKRIFATYNCPGSGGKIIPVFEADAPPWLKRNTPKPFLNALVSFDFGETPAILHNTPFGANMAFKREVFDRFGLFRTDLGPVADNLLGKGEDSEFASRLNAAGEPLMYAPDAIIYHPVEKERLKKKYFIEWYYNLGRAQVRRTPPPEGTVCICGVPRYLYRQLLTAFAKWFIAGDADGRLRNKLELYQKIGEAVESFSRSRRHSADSQAELRCRGAGNAL